MNFQYHICGMGAYIPARCVTNRDLEAMMDTSDEWIVSRTGICERHVLSMDENVSDAAFFAARDALVDAGVDTSEVTHILVSTCTPEHLSPSVACLVARKLSQLGEMSKKLAAVDLNAACSGFLYGLEFARAVLALHPDAVILLIAAEALSRRLNYGDRSTAVLFGDGAGAFVLRAEADGRSVARVSDVVLGADGQYADLIEIGGGTSFHGKVGDPVDESFFVRMQGSAVFKQAVRCMAQESLNILARNGLSASDVELFIPHQANQRIMDAVASRLDIPAERIFSNVARYGNTSAASIAIALVEARAEGRLSAGQKTLLTTFGAGLTWASALLN